MSEGGVHVVETVVQDIRYGLRVLSRNPGFAAVAVLTLGLGIGANTAIFSVINAALIRPLPFRKPERLVQLWETETAPGQFPLSGPDYLDWQAQNHTLQASSLYSWQQNFNASGAGEPEEVAVVSTEANFFSVLGVEPVLGRTFVRGEDRSGRDHVAILSFGFWQQHFGGRRDVLGGIVELNLQKYTVVGVMPEWFRLVGTANIWVPLDMAPEALGQRGSHTYRVIGRLKANIKVAQAQADLGTIAKRLETEYPGSNRKVGAAVVPLKRQLVGDLRPELLVMMGAVALVLLIACVNVANLLLVRAAGRRGEVAIRHALGAPPNRIARQLLTESVLLWLIGGSFGLGFAWAGMHFLRPAEPAFLLQSHRVTLDGTVLLFTLGVSVLAGLLFGLAPSWQISHAHFYEELKSDTQVIHSPTGKRRRASDALVIAEITISLALLVGAGLLLRSFARLRQVHIGVPSQGVLTAQIALPPRRYTTPGQIRAFYRQLLGRLNGAPGVQAAAISTEIPLEAGRNGYIMVPGQKNPALRNILVEADEVSQNYFRVWSIPFLKGRNLNGQDFRYGAEVLRQINAMMKSGRARQLPAIEFSAVINETMAKTFWPGEEALGRVFKVNGEFPVRVIGVVADVKEYVRGPVAPQAYYPATLAFEAPNRPIFISLSGRGDLAAALRSNVAAEDPDLALFRVRTMEMIISQAAGRTRYEALLLALFALLALILTAVGVYGVTSYAVRQRTPEIAMRMALGARPCDILKLVVGRALVLTLTGVGLGIIAALGLTRFIATLLFGIAPTDPMTLVLASMILTAVGLIASLIPARRAMKLNPAVALRDQ